MKIGLQLFTLRDYLQDEVSIYQTFKKVKDMGYDIVQVSGIGLITNELAKIIKKASEKYQLEIIATHVSFEQLLNEFDHIVSVHKMWNCQYIGIGMMPKDYSGSLAGFDKFIQIVNDLANRLSLHDLHLVYHNHAFEFRKFENKLGMDYLFDSFNDNVQFELDTYWIQKGGQSPEKWIKKVSGRMDIVHFKDMTIIDWDKQLMDVIGKGNLDWKEVISLCINTNVKYAFVEQDFCQGRDPFLCAQESLEYLMNYEEVLK